MSCMQWKKYLDPGKSKDSSELQVTYANGLWRTIPKLKAQCLSQTILVAETINI